MGSLSSRVLRRRVGLPRGDGAAGDGGGGRDGKRKRGGTDGPGDSDSDGEAEREERLLNTPRRSGMAHWWSPPLRGLRASVVAVGLSGSGWRAGAAPRGGEARGRGRLGRRGLARSGAGCGTGTGTLEDRARSAEACEGGRRGRDGGTRVSV